MASDGGGCHLRLPGHIVTSMAVWSTGIPGGKCGDVSGGPAAAAAARA